MNGPVFGCVDGCKIMFIRDADNREGMLVYFLGLSVLRATTHNKHIS